MKTLKVLITFLSIGFVIGLLSIQLTKPHLLKNAIRNYLEIGHVVPDPTKDSAETLPVISERKQINLSQKFLEDVRQYTIPNAVKRAKPAVVGISVTSVERVMSRDPFDFFFGRRYRNRLAQSTGSGFIISEDGFVVTNQHVIENAKEIEMTLPDGTHYRAELVGQDPQTDIALIKVIDANRQFPVLEIGNSDSLMIGDWAIAIGNPFGLTSINNQPTVTQGIISALNRDFGHISGKQRVYEDMIQTDAAINSGNSGGPLINILGQVIGMNTFIYTGGSGAGGNVGIAFSIPINKVVQIVKQLKNGNIDRDIYTGIINGFTLDDRWAKYYKVSKGVLITELAQNSPASRAGLKKGDIIVEANGFKIRTTSDFQEAVYFSGLKVGDLLPITVIRSKKEMNVSLVLEKINY